MPRKKQIQTPIQDQTKTQNQMRIQKGERIIPREFVGDEHDPESGFPYEMEFARGPYAQPGYRVCEPRTGRITKEAVKRRALQVVMTALDSIEARVVDSKTSSTQVSQLFDKLQDFVVSAELAMDSEETDNEKKHDRSCSEPSSELPPEPIPG